MERLNARLYYGALAAMLVLAIVSAYFALTTGERETKEIEVCRYRFYDSLDYRAYLTNNTLFETRVLRNPPRIFPNITESFVAYYTFFAECSNCSEVSGIYEVEAVVRTKHWNKTILLLGPKHFSGSYTITLPINLNHYYELYDRISKELGFESTDATLTLKFITRVKSERNFTATYEHPLTIPLNRKVADVVTKQHMQRTKVVREKVESVSGQKLVLKYSSAVICAMLLISASAFAKRFKPRRGELTEDEKLLRKYRDIVVLGKSIGNISKEVEIQSFEELLKIAEFANRPIIKIGKEFIVIADDVAYVFRL